MTKEERYIELFLNPIRKCKDYKPKFGDSQNEDGISLENFLALYGSDPFYSWIGLDSGLMYAAHKAAGGMTSLYRQIGIGCERLFREIIIETSQYEDRSMALWSYEIKSSSGKIKVLSLDGRLELKDIRNNELKIRVKRRMRLYCKDLSINQIPKNGIVFEVRQEYKSKDSKRQNADIDNATVAWANGYIPIFVIFSSQIDADIVQRYRNNRCGIMIGTRNSEPIVSLFSFSKDILGYDLAEFFERNTDVIKKEINIVLKTLLDAN